MVATRRPKTLKQADKSVVSKIQTAEIRKHVLSGANNKSVVSPSISPSTSDEVALLKAQNKAMREALESINRLASQQQKDKFDMVWYAKYRFRFPNYKAAERIDNDVKHQEEIKKLRSDDGDYHHGFNCGILAASRVFSEQSKLDTSKLGELGTELMAETSKHTERIQQAESKFPDLEVEHDAFPTC